MPGFLILLLSSLWLYAAYEVHVAGSTPAAIVMALVGLGLAVWRFRARAQ